MCKTKYIITVALLLMVILPQCKKESISNPAYAIGTVIYYQKGDNLITSAQITYMFHVNYLPYFNQYTDKKGGKGWKVPLSGDYKQGDKFIVQYEANNPNCNTFGSRMLFDYRVNDSTDYKRYVNEFINNPPQ
ncbi:MAG: hypothetical protein ABR968_12245 [Bacteroidales bacterium]